MASRLLTLMFVLAASAAAAQPTGDGLDKAQNEQRLKEQRLQRTAQDAAATRAEIDALAQQLARLAAQQSRGGDEVAAARARLGRLNAREAELTQRMGANRSRLSRLLGTLQMYGKHPPPAVFVHPDDARDAVRAAILVRAITPQLKAQAQALGEEVAAAQAVRREAASASEGLFLSESEFAGRAAEIEQLIGEKAAIETALNAEAGQLERDLVALTARIQNLRGGALPDRAAAPSPAAQRFATPVDGDPAARFGQVDGRGGRLEGWLWRPGPAARVRSPAAGLVDYAGPLEDWANVIILDVGDDRRLVLAGVGALQVEAGESLEAGQLIALMPAARSPAPELYLEVRRAGEPVDPARYFAAIRQ